MSKAIKWQIPFASLSGTLYRLDIYAEGYTGDPIQLTAGETPFVTDEDSSEDFFAPIRTQSGSIQVCTRKPDGTMLTLDEILPANNIDHPVRLINLDNSNAIEWQGFLSCEAYSQNYTAIPENLSLPVISVLEAMDSVEVELSENMAFQRILSHCIYAMKAIETKSGMSLFNTIFLDGHCQYETIANYFYNNVYFETDEQISGDNIVVDVHSVSCKTILEIVAKFFGCCWREASGQNIYFEAVGKTGFYTYDTFSNMYNSLIAGTSTLNLQSVNATTANLASSEWMGTGHQRTVMQGMRRVKVSAKLSEFDIDMTLQETPVNNLVENPDARQSANGEVHVNTNETFYSLAEHKHYLTKAIFPTDLSGASLQLTSTLSGINYAHTIFWETSEFRQYYYELVNTQTKGSNSGLNHYITSFMAWWRDRENELQSGLMICGVPKYLLYSTQPVQGRTWNKYAMTANNYLFRQRTPLIFAATKGYLKIDINTLAWSNAPGTMPSIVYGTIQYPTLTIALQFGNKWAYKDGDTYKWSSSFQTIDFPLEHKQTNDVLKTLGNWSESMGVEESDGIFIEIPEFMVGLVSVRVYPFVNALCADPYTNSMFDVFINKMDVEYVAPKEELRTDRSENVYATETSQAFRDELSLDVDLASYANNTKLATMVWQSDGVTPVKLMNLDGASVRPEVNLLNRLASYYGAARQTLDLIVKHPTAAALPLLKLNGIGDGKQYLPLSESRDWREETCTIKCFETPNE